MKKPESGTGRASNRRTTGRRDLPSRSALWPAIVASGACSVLSAPASALQLGNVDVHSNLGQPLRASIAFALSPNEQLQDYCIFLQPPAAGLPGIRDAVIGVSNGRINIRGTTAVKEPIVSLGIAVSCPYTANLTRSYTLMVDPAPMAADARSAGIPAVAGPAVRSPAEVPQPAPVAARENARPAAAAPRNATPIAAGSYRVRPGDTLSDVVSRIENRSIGLWAAVGVVFDANPDAFIDGDVNRLKAGSVLSIPSLDGQSVAHITATPAAENPAASAPVSAPETTSAVAEPADLAPESNDAGAAEATIEPAIIETADPAWTSFDQTVDLQPGEVSATSSVSEIDPPETGDPASAARTAGPEVVATAESSPVTVASIPSWAYWIVSGAALLGVALGLFGWRSRRQTPPQSPAADSMRPQDRVVDLQLDDTSDSIAWIDADLEDGTGFDAAGDVDVAQDFGFSTSRDLGADLDMVLPAAGEKEEADTRPIQIGAVPRPEETTILEKEILPSDDEDDDVDYDLSMIVDATEQQFSDEQDVTAKHLKAVAVEKEDETTVSETAEDTLTSEFDYQVLEQDYEDELTATQALNAEIQKAAEEIQSRINARAGGSTSTSDVTSLLESAGDDTDVNEALGEESALTIEETSILDGSAVAEHLETGVEKTVDLNTIDAGGDAELEEFADDRTAKIPVARVESRKMDDTKAATGRLTAKLPSAGNDDTAELTIDSGHFRKRKSTG